MAQVKTTSFRIKDKKNQAWLRAQSDNTKSLNILIELAIANFGYVDLNELYQEALRGLIHNTKLDTSGITNQPTQALNTIPQILNSVAKPEPHLQSTDEKKQDDNTSDIYHKDDSTSKSKDIDEEEKSHNDDNKDNEENVKTSSSSRQQTNKDDDLKRDELLKKMGVLK